MLKRSITHWTAGTGRASALDLEHYHGVTEVDGTFVHGKEEPEDNIVTSDGDYAAHVLNLNTGSGGFAMAGMMGAVESPFDPGRYPITETQFEAHCKRIARFHLDYNILPITDRNCLTHAEIEGTLGVKQRGKWDLTRLPFRPDLIGARAVGDYMRERVNFYLGGKSESDLTSYWQRSRPILRIGERGAFVYDLQDQLMRLKYYPGRRDGRFGKATRAAVLAFQADNGLQPDGAVGPMTWRALMGAEPRDLGGRTQEGVEDLRAAGSKTIAAADRGEKVIAGTAGVAGGGAALDTVIDMAGKIQRGESAIAALQEILMNNWPVLLVLAAAFAAWWFGRRAMAQVRDRRVEDHNSGKNMGAW